MNALRYLPAEERRLWAKMRVKLADDRAMLWHTTAQHGGVKRPFHINGFVSCVAPAQRLSPEERAVAPRAAARPMSAPAYVPAHERKGYQRMVSSPHRPYAQHMCQHCP